jgi:hypothetical protein
VIEAFALPEPRRYPDPQPLDAPEGAFRMTRKGRAALGVQLPFMGTAVRSDPVPSAVRGDGIAGVFRDELGVEYVAV